jgi:hypothetical protein
MFSTDMLVSPSASGRSSSGLRGQNVKLAIGTGKAGGVPSGPAGRSSTGDGATRVTIGRSDARSEARSGFGLGDETERALAIGFDVASRGSADVVAGFLETGAAGFAFAPGLALAFVPGLALAFAPGLALATILAWALTLAALGAGRALPDTRFFCAGLEDFIALAMGVPR